MSRALMTDRATSPHRMTPDPPFAHHGAAPPFGAFGGNRDSGEPVAESVVAAG